MEIREISRATGDYLKALYTLELQGESASTNALAGYLEVRQASVTNMLQKLAAEDPALVDYTKHYGARLTLAGRSAALRLVRRHRLVESFLERVLGYSWDAVHAEAEELEHVISQRFEDRLAELLGEPAFDPHGDPIPDRELRLPADPSIPLGRLAVGVPACIRRVSGRDPEVLQHLGAQGLLPGVALVILDRNSLDQTLRLRTDEMPSVDIVLGPSLANAIWVEVEQCQRTGV
jgi:DtxR family Mn-dependent transcriptional regulator